MTYSQYVVREVKQMQQIKTVVVKWKRIRERWLILIIAPAKSNKSNKQSSHSIELQKKWK